MRHLEYVQSSPELETDGAAVRHGRVEGSQSSISCKENISPVDLPIQNNTGLVFCRRDPALAQGFREQVLGNDAADLRRDAASDPCKPVPEQNEQLLRGLRRIAELREEPLVHGLSGRKDDKRPDPSSLKRRMDELLPV